MERVGVFRDKGAAGDTADDTSDYLGIEGCGENGCGVDSQGGAGFLARNID